MLPSLFTRTVAWTKCRFLVMGFLLWIFIQGLCLRLHRYPPPRSWLSLWSILVYVRTPSPLGHSLFDPKRQYPRSPPIDSIVSLTPPPRLYFYETCLIYHLEVQKPSQCRLSIPHSILPFLTCVPSSFHGLPPLRLDYFVFP